MSSTRQDDVTHSESGHCSGSAWAEALSLFAACRNPEVGACAVFYGGHPNISPDLESLQAPVLGIYAGKDTFVTPDVVKELDRQLTTLGRRHGVSRIRTPSSAFFNDERPGSASTASPRQTPGPRPSPSSGASCGLRYPLLAMLWRAALVLVAAAAALLPLPASIVERAYSTALYPRLSRC